MAGSERLICAAAELADRGKAVRFEVEHCGETAAAFVIRFGGAVYGYLNRCGHRSIELDWREGEVFDSEGRLTSPVIAERLRNHLAALVDQAAPSALAA